MACCSRKPKGSLLRAALTAALLCGLPSAVGAGKPVRLTSDGKLKFSPVFCNEGKEIIYVTLEKPELYRLQRLSLATGKVEPLHRTAATSEFEPAFSADGRYFAFLRLRGVLSVGVVIRTWPPGRKLKCVPPMALPGSGVPPSAPDGSRVLFSSAEAGRQQIYSVDVRGRDRKALTDMPGSTPRLATLPTGKRIAFSSTRNGNYEIYAMDADGGNVRRLTRNPYQDLRPRFSPDGKRIVFTSHRDGNAEIYVMNVDGSGQRRLTRNPERDDYPTWHPDGKRLIIVSERDGRHDLYLLDVDD